MSASLLEQLQALHKNGPQSMRHGICLQVSWLAVKEHDTLQHLMVTWPAGTSDTTFPVPASRSDKTASSAQLAYRKASREQMWDRNTEYGQLRWELLEWLIEELQK